jgi:ComF family protein
MYWFFRHLLDCLYPPRCQVCKQFAEEAFCAACREQVVRIKPPICRNCGLPLDPQATGPELCPDCREAPSPITWARAAGIYQGTLQQAILNFKFSGRRVLAKPLAGLLAETYGDGLCPKETFDAVGPVPLHPQRRKERGYNQSELLAEYFCRATGLELAKDLLQRVRPTLPQVMLPRPERAKNVRGAFAVRDKSAVTGKAILLIDDIATTGATIEECARVLTKAGAEKVCLLTVARPRPPWMTPVK